MLIKTGDAQILDLVNDDEALDDAKTRQALHKATKRVTKQSKQNVEKSGNKTESNTDAVEAGSPPSSVLPPSGK